MDICIEGGYVYKDGGIIRADVGVDAGKIREIGDVGDSERTLNASGSLVLPGLVNSHTHASMTLMRGYADDLPLQRWLEEKVWPVEAELTGDDIYHGARLGILEMIKSGTTCFNDMYFQMDRVADAVEESGVRARLGVGMITEGKDEDEVRQELWDGVEFAEEYHGAADGRIRTTVSPHAPYTCNDWLLENAADKARELNLPVHIHLSETEEEVEGVVAQEGMRPTWYLDDRGCFDEDAVLAHCVHLDKEEIRFLGERDVGVAHCPNANMKLASGVAPVAQMLDKGVKVGIGTDGPVSNNNLDMFEEARAAALLAKVDEMDASVLPDRQVLDMATYNGAYALGFNTGRIEVGRPADIVVVDLDAPHLNPRNDLISHAVYSAKGSDVTDTIVDGEVLMEDREVLTMNEDAVVEQASEAAEELISRAEN